MYLNVFIYDDKTVFRDKVVAACWRLSDLGFGHIRLRKYDVDVQSFVLRNVAAQNIRNIFFLEKFIRFLCCCLVGMN